MNENQGKYVRNVDIGSGLTLSCYSKKAFYDRHWTPETIGSRGHVRDAQGTLVSRPFEKIFNLGERSETTAESIFELHKKFPDSMFVAVEKFNGHLAILFHHNGEWIVTTKGGADPKIIVRNRMFIEQAVDLNRIDKALTYCFEIMDPEGDPHVLHGMMKATRWQFLNVAILIAVRETETGLYKNMNLVKGIKWQPIVPKVEFRAGDSFEEFTHNISNLRGDENTISEGWVVYLLPTSATDRVDPISIFKIKSAQFLKYRYYWYGELRNLQKVQNCVMAIMEGRDPDCDEELIPVYEKILYDASNNQEGIPVQSWLSEQTSFSKYTEFLAWQ